MLRLRLTIDRQPRTNSGEPAHSTTGVASINSIHGRSVPGITCESGWPVIMSDISISISGIVSAVAIQNRRVMSASSGDAWSPALTTRGSNVIPQIGQLPGSERTICGCIGQTYSVFETGWLGATDSSAIPHLGHGPGWFCRISGCIGHVYEGAPASARTKAPSPAAAGFGAARLRKLSGSRLNLSRQRMPQKWYVAPWCSNDPALLAGSTCIPHTGSTTLPLKWLRLSRRAAGAGRNGYGILRAMITVCTDHGLIFSLRSSVIGWPLSTSCLRNLVVHPSCRVIGLTTVLNAATSGFELWKCVVMAIRPPGLHTRTISDIIRYGSGTTVRT